MGKFSKALKTAKSLVGIGNIKKPKDWPINNYAEELSHVGGFKDSIVSTAKGMGNRSLMLLVNSEIVDVRDQQILKYLKEKGIEL